MNDLDLYSRSKGHKKHTTCEIIHSVAKWHEVAQTFAVADCVKEMTVKKFYKNG